MGLENELYGSYGAQLNWRKVRTNLRYWGFILRHKSTIPITSIFVWPKQIISNPYLFYQALFGMYPYPYQSTCLSVFKVVDITKEVFGFLSGQLFACGLWLGEERRATGFQPWSGPVVDTMNELFWRPLTSKVQSKWSTWKNGST
jgi:hypothetical protein